MRIPIEESTIYHEAGHAAAFWHYGVPLERVTIKPDLARGYGGGVKPAIEPPAAGRSELENWMRASAAGRAAENHRCGIAVPKTADLIAKFSLVVADLIDNPDSPGHHDLRNFVILGQRRDEEGHGIVAVPETGPAGWAQVWLEAEELIRGKLWLAVQAIAERLLANAYANEGRDISNLRDLSGVEVAAIAALAMAKAAPSGSSGG